MTRRGPAGVALLVAAHVAFAKVPPHVEKARALEKMETCKKTIDPSSSLSDEIAALPAGAVLCLTPGVYPVNAVISRAITLRGIGAPGDVILDGGGRATVLRLSGDQPSLVAERLTVRGGANGEGGGGVACTGSGTITLRDVVLEGNRADRHGGAALYVAGGTTILERCRVMGNSGGVGGAIIADGVATVHLHETLVADNTGTSSAIFVHDNAELTLDHVTIVGNRAAAAIEVLAIAVRTPSVRIADSIVVGAVAVENGPRLPGQVIALRSLVHGKQSGVTDGGGNRSGPPGWVGADQEPWRPGPRSPAIGIANPGHGTDVCGHAAGTTAGAIQAAH